MMPVPLFEIPELSANANSAGMIRLPHQSNVYVTARVQRLIDSAPFRRLSRISQLGLVREVYPGARHSRFEHSVGVYQMATRYSEILAQQSSLEFDPSQIETFLLSALLHDLAHWPYCHPIEDMRLANVRSHEERAREIITDGEICQLIKQDWSAEPDAVADLLSGDGSGAEFNALKSMLNGPIDIDKMDYLQRDSLHAGVPYGQNFDRERLIQSLCFDSESQRLGITEKGRTAAEMMVFARYVMFSEVYWHHAVRSATAMLQRLVYRLLDESSSAQEVLAGWQASTESDFERDVLLRSSETSVEPLANGLFGPSRRLYKRVSQFNVHEHSDLHAALSHRPYVELVEISERLGQQIASVAGVRVPQDAVMIDASPVKLEVQFKLSVRNSQGQFTPLSELSPVVKALATEQFDSVVKRVRIFVHPDLRSATRSIDLPNVLSDCL